MVVAGAGASRELGAGEESMPLMSDWARDLVESMSALSTNLPYAMGLNADLSGEAFETVLGDFLSWSASLESAKKLRFIGSSTLGQQEAAIEEWFLRSETVSNEILRAIHGSLHRLFGQSRINAVAAATAYGGLFKRLGIEDRDLLAFATTNYDVAAELALETLGKRPYWGEDTVLGTDSVVRPTFPNAQIGKCFVFHLHGRVGWYRTAEGHVIGLPPDKAFDESAGVPALLLPDPNKDYAGDVFTSELWRGFRTALSNSSRVLVLGHSLHDQHLVEALRALSPGTVAVSILPSDGQNMRMEAMRISTLLPGCHVLPMSFGPSSRVDNEAVEAFLDNRVPVSMEPRELEEI